MRIDSEKKRRQAMDTKLAFMRLMHKHELSQEDFEFLLGVHQSTISRWCNPQDEMLPPIYAIAAAAQSEDERFNKWAVEFLDALELLAGRSAQPLTAKADGKLDDEFQDAAIAEGKFAEALKNNDLEAAEEIARQFQSIASRMLVEIREYRKQKKA